MTRQHLRPDDAQLGAFLSADLQGPVVMVNLLRYATAASTDHPGAAADTSTPTTTEAGSAAYARYGSAFLELLAEVGGRIVWSGTPVCTLIGDDGVDTWDQVVLVEYPSRDAFITATSNQRYREASADRSRGLAATVLLVCETTTPDTPDTPAGPAAPAAP